MGKRSSTVTRSRTVIKIIVAIIIASLFYRAHAATTPPPLECVVQNLTTQSTWLSSADTSQTKSSSLQVLLNIWIRNGLSNIGGIWGSLTNGGCPTTGPEPNPWYQLVLDGHYYVSGVAIATASYCSTCSYDRTLKNFKIEVGLASAKYGTTAWEDEWTAGKQLCMSREEGVEPDTTAIFSCMAPPYGNYIRITMDGTGNDVKMSLCDVIVSGSVNICKEYSSSTITSESAVAISSDTPITHSSSMLSFVTGTGFYIISESSFLSTPTLLTDVVAPTFPLSSTVIVLQSSTAAASTEISSSFILSSSILAVSTPVPSTDSPLTFFHTTIVMETSSFINVASTYLSSSAMLASDVTSTIPLTSTVSLSPSLTPLSTSAISTVSSASFLLFSSELEASTADTFRDSPLISFSSTNMISIEMGSYIVSTLSFLTTQTLLTGNITSTFPSSSTVSELQSLAPLSTSAVTTVDTLVISSPELAQSVVGAATDSPIELFSSTNSVALEKGSYISSTSIIPSFEFGMVHNIFLSSSSPSVEFISSSVSIYSSSSFVSRIESRRFSTPSLSAYLTSDKVYSTFLSSTFPSYIVSPYSTSSLISYQNSEQMSSSIDSSIELNTSVLSVLSSPSTTEYPISTGTVSSFASSSVFSQTQYFVSTLSPLPYLISDSFLSESDLSLVHIEKTSLVSPSVLEISTSLTYVTSMIEGTSRSSPSVSSTHAESSTSLTLLPSTNAESSTSLASISPTVVESSTSLALLSSTYAESLASLALLSSTYAESLASLALLSSTYAELSTSLASISPTIVESSTSLTLLSSTKAELSTSLASVSPTIVESSTSFTLLSSTNAESPKSLALLSSTYAESSTSLASISPTIVESSTSLTLLSSTKAELSTSLASVSPTIVESSTRLALLSSTNAESSKGLALLSTTHAESSTSLASISPTIIESSTRLTLLSSTYAESSASLALLSSTYAESSTSLASISPKIHVAESPTSSPLISPTIAETKTLSSTISEQSANLLLVSSSTVDTSSFKRETLLSLSLLPSSLSLYSSMTDEKSSILALVHTELSRKSASMSVIPSTMAEESTHMLVLSSTIAAKLTILSVSPLTMAQVSPVLTSKTVENPTMPSSLSSSISSLSPSSPVLTSSSTIPIWCPCTCEQAEKIDSLTSTNKTTEEVAQELEELLSEQTVDASATSSSQRKLVSVTDERQSSKVVGTVGMAFFVCVFGLIVLSDVPVLIRVIKRGIRLVSHLRASHNAQRQESRRKFSNLGELPGMSKENSPNASTGCA